MSEVIDSVADSAFEGVGKIASHHGSWFLKIALGKPLALGDEHR
jgi:hypothetical protein